MICPNCNMDLPEGTRKSCPKCDAALILPWKNEIHEIDIAHGGESAATALKKVENAIAYALLERFKGIKFIHGYGSKSDHTSIIRDKTLPALQNKAREMGWKLVQDKRSPGAHILYFNR